MKRYNCFICIPIMISLAILGDEGFMAKGAGPEQTTESNSETIIDEDSLKLTFKTFVYNNDLEKALSVAEKGYQQSKSWYWLEKCAQTARWQNSASKALQYYWEKYRRRERPEDAQAVIELAESTTEYTYLLRIYHHMIRKGKDKYQELQEAYAASGQLKAGIRYFKKLLNTHPENTEIKASLLRLTLMAHDFQQALNLYNQNPALVSENAELALAISSILFVKGRKRESYTVLKEAAPRIDHTDSHFRQRAVDLGWLNRDYTSVYAWLRILQGEGNLRKYDRERLIALARYYKADDVLSMTNEAWITSGKNYHLFDYINYALQTEQYQTLQKWLQGLDDEGKTILKSSPEFWLSRANLYTALDTPEKAFACYQNAGKLSPHNARFHERYLFFLVAHQYVRHLKAELRWLQRHPEILAELYVPAAQAASSINQHNKARNYLKKAFSKNPELKTTENLIFLANLFELNDQTQRAMRLRLKLWRELTKFDKKKDTASFKNRLNLSFYFATPATIRSMMKQAKSLLPSRIFQEYQFAYSVMRSQYEPARWILQRKAFRKPWAELSIALADNDSDSAFRLIEKYPELLPITDRTKAADLSGQRALAFEMGFEGLENNPHYSPLYTQFHNLVMNTKTPFNMNTAIRTSDGLFLNQWRITRNLRLRKGFFLPLAYTHTMFSSSERQYPFTPNAKISTVGIGVKKENWKAMVKSGYANSNKTFAFLKGALSFDWGIFDFSANFGIHQLSQGETHYLRLGGYEDMLKLSMNAKLSKRISTGLSMYHKAFSAQDNTALGRGRSLMIDSRFQLRSGYPDINFRLYAQNNTYKTENTRGSIREILPFPQATVLPEDFSQFGSELAIGVTNKYSYNRLWRPYGTIGLYHNTESGNGGSVSIGAGGRLFGQDLLSITMGYNQGMGSNQYSSGYLMLNYQIWNR